ncbi:MULTISPECIES: curli-like amyloid fiber formation chaperone CsgH [unclassified Mesorhizobium]|uniref:curli-like amyloid fiber formation chaperone CsgH n=1 Tax=unclassified Mesorhizobium TaxID=325217 RepID=UPI003014348A
MRHAAVLFVGLAAACGAGGAVAQDGGAIAAPSIAIVPTEAGVQITASAVGFGVAEIEGSVEIDRTGGSGTVTTRQNRTLKLSAGQSQDIARTALSLAKGDRISIRVVLRQDGRVVGKAEVSSGEP